MKRLLSLFVVLSIVAISPVAFAQDGKAQEQSGQKKDFESFDLGELYIKGDKLPTVQEVTEITEFTAADIEATHSQTVAEALSYVPGVIVTTGRKNEPFVKVHGLNQQETKVLIDGVPYYETKYGSLDLNSIPVDNIARIEIQKGVSSVLYGPNALAGVINIITKKPTTRPSLDARFEVGDYNSVRYSLSHGMKVGVFSYWFGYDHREADGWYLSRDFEPRQTTVRYSPTIPLSQRTFVLEDGGVRENSDSKTDGFWAKVGIEPSKDSEYFLNFHYITREKGGPASLINDANRVFTTFGSSGAPFSQFWRFPTYNNWGLDLSGQQKLGDRVTLKGKLFYHDHVDELESFRRPDYVESLSLSRYKDYVLGASLMSDIKVASNDTLRAAFSYLKDSHKETTDVSLPFEESVSYTGSFGVENEFNPLKDLSLVAGLSYDWWDVSGAEKSQFTSTGVFRRMLPQRTPDDSEWSPMLGVRYTLFDGTKLFASWARKVRFPTLQYLYSSNTGNVDLKPEKSNNYILGASRGLGRYVKTEASFFVYDINDMIMRPSADATALYQNVGKVFLYGFEVLGEVFPTKDLSLRLGYMYNNATNKTSGSPTERVAYVPVHKVDLGVKYLIPTVKVGVDLTGTYVSRIWGQLPTNDRPSDAPIRTGDYFIIDARISKAFYKNFEVYFAAKNVLDKDYEQEIGFPSPGRNLFLGVKYSY